MRRSANNVEKGTRPFLSGRPAAFCTSAVPGVVVNDEECARDTLELLQEQHLVRPPLPHSSGGMAPWLDAAANETASSPDGLLYMWVFVYHQPIDRARMAIDDEAMVMGNEMAWLGELARFIINRNLKHPRSTWSQERG